MDAHIRTQDYAAEAYRPAQISWGSVFAGWFLAAACALLLYILGSAIGLTGIDVADANAVEKGIAFGTVVWVFLTWAVTMYLGGFFASWLTGKANRMTGFIHGAMVWAFSSVLAVILGVSGLTGLLRLGSSIGQSVATAGTAVATAAGNAGNENQGQQGGADLAPIQQGLKDRMSQIVAQAGGADQNQVREAIDKLDQQKISVISGQLIRADFDGAKNTLTQGTGLSPQQIDRIMNGLRSEVNQATTQVKQVADQVNNYASAALWIAFFSNAIGLLCAALGGMAGARVPVYDARAYAFRQDYERKEGVA